MTAAGSDKGAGWHNYTMFYHFLFHERRNAVRSLFEVGIGTNFADMPSNMGGNGIPGASLRGWRDYFPEAQIVGADADRRVLFSEERITTYYVDQLDSEAIDALWEAVPQSSFDVVIDDGLHAFQANSCFMRGSFDKVNDGGFYIIEDIVSQYDNLKNFDEFFKKFGASGALIQLPNPLNKFDNCLAIFVPDTESGQHGRYNFGQRTNVLDMAYTSLFDQIAEAAQASHERRWEEAWRLWQAILSRTPDDVTATVGFADSLVEMHRLDDADSVLTQAVAQFPGDRRLALRHAQLPARRSDWGEASRRWEPLRSRFSDAIEMYAGLGEALCQLGRIDEAEETYRDAIARFPENLWIRLSYGSIAARRRDWDGAIKRAQEVRNRFPDAPQGYVVLGDALREAGRLDEADLTLAEAVARFSDDLWIRVSYASVAARRRDWDSAIRRAKELQNLFPDASQGYVVLGDALREAGRLDEADLTLAEAVKRFPDALWAAVQHALVAVRRQDWSEALRRWELTRFRFPSMLNGYIGTAEAAIMLERWDLAVEKWQAVRLNFPDEHTGYVGQADALRRTGRVVEADEVVQLGLRRFPANEALRIEAIRLALGDGNQPEAARRWRDVAAYCPAPAVASSGPRLDLRKQIALLRPGFDPNSIDLNRRLTGTVLSEDPLIILSAGPAFDVIEATAPYYADRTVYFFVGMLWTIAHNSSYAQEYKERFSRLKSVHPNLTITVLANDMAELLVLRELGIHAELINHNAFVDENIFTILPIPRKFDAIYNARSGVHKRHQLAQRLENIKLIISEATTDALKFTTELLPQATIANDSPSGIMHLTPEAVAYHLNTAKCGLCLSAIEGAMFSSMEYLLCGLPVVTTPNVGGRNWFFTNDCVVFCEDTAEAVAEAVERVNREAIPPKFVRESARQRIKRERLAFFALIDGVFRETGQEVRRFEAEFERMFFDKINYIGRYTGDFLVP